MPQTEQPFSGMSGHLAVVFDVGSEIDEAKEEGVLVGAAEVNVEGFRVGTSVTLRVFDGDVEC